jgi:hypothetical protein
MQDAMKIAGVGNIDADRVSTPRQLDLLGLKLASRALLLTDTRCRKFPGTGERG